MRGQRPMSTFGADKFTTRSREAIEAAQLSATTGGHTQTEPIHLLVALLREQEGTARNLVTKAGVAADSLTGKVDATLSRMTTASRPEERRVRKAGVSTCNSRWLTINYKTIK